MYQKPSKPCTRKRRNLTRLDKATKQAQTKKLRRTRYWSDPVVVKAKKEKATK